MLDSRAARLSTLGILFCVALTACGGGDDSPDPTPTPPPPADGGTPPPPADGGTPPPPADGGTPPPAGDGSAAACYPSTLFQVGRSVDSKYKLSGDVDGTMTMSHKVGTGAFDNVGNALAVDTVATSTFTAPAHLAGYTGTVTNKNYVNLEGGNTLVEYGGVGQIEVEGFETSYKVVYNPPTRDERWKLPAGESMDRTSTSTTTSTVLGITTSETVTIRERITYHGRETVTVPAGTFQTCKFSITDLDDTLQPSYEWTQVGTGLVVKGTSWEEDSGETLMELTHSSL